MTPTPEPRPASDTDPAPGPGSPGRALANPPPLANPGPRRLQVALLLIALLVLVLAVRGVVNERQRVQRDAALEAELYARVVEGQVSRVVDAASGALRALAAHPALALPVRRGEIEDVLAQQLSGQPYLRSLSLLDETGTILASTTAADTGRRIDLAALGRAPSGGLRERLGPLQPVRDLGELAAERTAQPVASALPLLRGLGSTTGHRWLVALINVDYIANQQALITGGQPVRALTLSLDGTLIDGGGSALAPGTPLGGLAPFTQFLPQRELGHYTGPGSDGQTVIGAFRTARNWPLVVVAEQPLEPVLAAWRAEAAVSGATAMAVVVLLGGLGAAAGRSARREARHRQRLDALHAEVARAEERWKLALEGAGHGVWDMDVASGRASLSPRLMALLGHAAEPAEWSTEDWRARVHPDDLEPGLKATRAHLQGDLPTLVLELRMRNAQGAWQWVLARGTRAAVDAGGRGTRLVGTLTDIDARRRTEAALRESEARQQAILRSALDGIVTVDAQGQVIDFNPAAEAIFGHRRDEVMGRPMHELIVPLRHRAAHQAGMARYQATGHGPLLNKRIQVQALRADGSEFPMELAIVPVATESGQVFTATVRDISERLRTEAALRDSQAVLDKVGRIAGVGGWVLDLKTQTTHWTDQTALIHDRPAGYQPATLEEAVAYYAPGAAETMGQAVQQAIASGEGFDLELPLITATGRAIWVRALGMAEFEDGQAVRMVGAFQDISARVRAEQELQQARSREVMIGARIQQTLLVDAPDQRLPGLWLSTLGQASQGIDGDFVELVRLGDRGVDIIVGDVMGKGVGAALMGAATKMQFSRCVTELLARPGRAGELPAPAEVLAAVHHAMTPRLQELDAFVTLSYLRLDTAEGRLTWVGCGHEEPLLLGADGTVRRLHNQHPPLGVLAEIEFEQASLPLARGDALFMCSDGASDALLPDGSRLGRERVEALLAGLLRELHTPAAALHALRREIDATGARLTDDLTLALALLPGDTVCASRRELAGGLADVAHVRGLVEHRAREAGLPEVEAGLFVVACVEAYTNAVRHTRGRPAGAPVELVVRGDRTELVVEIVTLGEAFEPAPVASDTDFGDFPEGGFGLTIMQQAADEVQHLHARGVNTVRLRRRLR